MAEISNIKHTVPSSVRDLFLNCIPYGSEFVIYTKTENPYIYECISRSPVFHDYHVFQYDFSTHLLLELSDVDESTIDMSCEYPLYSYSSIRGNGVYCDYPIHNNLNSLLLIVVSSLLVMRTVFGGIKLWRSKK